MDFVSGQLQDGTRFRIATTKLPMLTKQGIWPMLHDARADFSMLFGLCAILLMGAGRLSLVWKRKRSQRI